MNNARTKTLLLLIGLLLIANIVLVIFLLKTPAESRRDRHNDMTAYLKNEIGFSPEQLVAYDSIYNRHRRQARSMFDEIRLNKTQSFKNIGAQGFSEGAIDSAARYAAGEQQKIERNILSHLKDIRAICSPQQRSRFDTGFYKALVRPRNDRSDK